MRSDVARNLSSRIEASVVNDLLGSFEGMVQKQKASDFDSALARAGKFVEHVFRTLEFIRTGSAPSEIKSPAKSAQLIEADTTQPDSVRLLIPRIALAMVYDIRSKRGAVHVKGIDPKAIDVDLAVKAASWILAEFIRLYHVDDEAAVKREMAALCRANFPYVESIEGETFVTLSVPPQIEMLLLLAMKNPEGVTRRDLGKMSKHKPPRVTEALNTLEDFIFIHKTLEKMYFITGPGESHLSSWIMSKT